MKNLPIGVFDSGMGGLTVLKALKNKMPLESFIYLGDTARLPYGNKSPDTVRQYAVQMVRFLVERQIKALVIACNTATTAALSHLTAMLPDIPVVGVINPGAQAAVNATCNKQVAVMATETTINSLAYQQAISALDASIRVNAQPCGLLAALAEEGMIANAVARAAFAHYLEPFSAEDTLLLGCTHYPVFTPLLQELLPREVTIVDSALATSIAINEALGAKNLQSSRDNSANTRYLVTDSISRFQRLGEIFLQDSLLAGSIELVDL